MITKHSRPRYRIALTVCGLIVAAILAAAVSFESATFAKEEYETMSATDQGPGRGLSDTNSPGARGRVGGSSGPSGPKGSGSKGSKGGSTIDPYGSRDKKKLKPIPDVPDSDGGAVTPEPLDLSLLAGEETPPQRRPLNNSGVGGGLVPQSGITGYAGIFIP
jgi:hypothetical protein